MAVQTLPPTNTTTKPTTMNPRLPPLANKTSLTYKLTSLSKQKLAREATAPDPDIRRCLGHFRLHIMSMEWAQKEMTTRINSFELEDESDEEEEAVVDEVKDMTEKEVVPEPPAPVSTPAEAEDESVAVDDEEEKEAQARFRVSFEQASTQPSSTPGSADLLDEVTTTIPPSELPVHHPEMAGASTNPLPTTHMQTQTNASANTTPQNSDGESEGEGEGEGDTATETDYETETQTDTETETAATDTDPETEFEPESDQKKSPEGTLLEKGRNCIEKTVQNSHFWPSHGQCMPVRISG